MSVLGLLLCCLTVFVSGNGVLLCFLVLSNFVMMNSFAVVVCRCLVVPGCIVVVLTCGVFQWHGMRPLKKGVRRPEVSPIGEPSENDTCGGLAAVRCGSKSPRQIATSR